MDADAHGSSVATDGLDGADNEATFPQRRRRSSCPSVAAAARRAASAAVASAQGEPRSLLVETQFLILR
jgi:hypothetical protein